MITRTRHILAAWLTDELNKVNDGTAESMDKLLKRFDEMSLEEHEQWAAAHVIEA